MGYAKNVAISMPLALISYMLTEKMIVSFTEDNKFNDRVQKHFVLGFIIGMTYIALGLTVFNEGSNIHNQSIQLALYISGGFLALNSMFFSWDDMDEETKIIILGICMVGLIVYTYHNNDDI